MLQWLRRIEFRKPGRMGLIRFGGVGFNFDSNTLHVEGQAVHLELKQSLVLIKLLAESPRVVSKDELLNFGWLGVPTGDDVLAVAISHLRKALGDSVRSPKYIKTLAGQGYQWIVPLSARYKSVARRVVEGDTSEDAAPQVWRWASLLGIVVVLPLLVFLLVRPDPLAEARRLMQSGDSARWPEALAIYEASYQSGDHSAETILGIVYAQWRILAPQPLHLFQALDELRAWLERAIEIEPENAQAYALLGQLEFLVAWNLPIAKVHLARAITLEPNNADFYLTMSNLELAQGDFADASESLKQARSIDPQHYAREMAAWIYNMQREYDQAKIELERLVEIRPDTLNYHVSAQSVLENSGDHVGSFHHLARVLELTGYERDDLQRAEEIFNESGLAGVYRWLLIDQQETRNIGQYEPPLAYARYAIQFGDADAAIDWLQRAVEARQYEVLWLNVDPKYDPIRNDPRFKSVIRAIGLPVPNNS